MDVNVIYWKLNEIMAKKRVRNKDLAKAIGVTENSVYRLRRTDEMPRLTAKRLNGICTFLQCQPGDLLKWTTDEPVKNHLSTIDVQQNSEEVVEKVEGEYIKPQKSHQKLNTISGWRLLESA